MAPETTTVLSYGTQHHETTATKTAPPAANGEFPTLSRHPYTIVKQIGTGGYGKVYLAENWCTGTKVAIKVMAQTRINRYLELNGERVPAEIAHLARVSHHSIIKYYNHFRVSGGWCLVMEYPAGFIDLFELICERGCMTERHTKQIIRQVLEVIEHCLVNKVDHRDIKDENILVDPTNMCIKLIDFGSASQLTEKAYTSFRGTDVYLPPEWYTKRSYSALPATSWAIGCLIFTCLSGDSPFASREELKNTQIPWHKLPAGLSAECHNLLRLCLQTSTRHRIDFSTMANHGWFRSSE